MRNITLSAQDNLIAQARALARARGSTLNDEFRLWLADFVAQTSTVDKQAQARALIDQIANIPRLVSTSSGDDKYPMDAENKYPRDQFNERELRLLKRLDEP